ncbi:hypothetical protein CR155_11070 [Pollutimonas nitritireducens]|uniref:ChsH2 rubredoxin-like zinc ribbon domain-containing protein n=1 Tax=Pollutimonas nitritireducens TaxID=2045209 RepID=A0A2N4UG20_9BURK|nr:zinc ribbon domain-containing protein [Pollutimonas nitritireducens]PLC53962.1 hypothetical protein CR155_11070 [Pollutimonas nitritireducens]
MSEFEIFEVELEDVYRYRLSYGGQSAYFHGLQNKTLVASRCSGCGFVWLPLRPICSKCYEPAHEYPLDGKGEVLTVVMLPETPEHLKHLGGRVASALVRPDGADTCIKAFVVTDTEELAYGTRVDARYLSEIRTIGDFYFVPDGRT